MLTKIKVRLWCGIYRLIPYGEAEYTQLQDIIARQASSNPTLSYFDENMKQLESL